REPDRLLGRPHAVRIEAEAIAGKRRGERTIALELVLGREHSALQLVAAKAVLLLERCRLLHELIGGSYLVLTVRVGIAIEEVGREGDAVAKRAAEDVIHRHVPLLTEQIEAGKFERGEDLRAVVVE